MGSYGEQNHSKIVKHVYELNREGTVKIFSMGFQGNADMELLDAIALMNGGVAAPILRGGTTDFAAQIVDFFSRRLCSFVQSLPREPWRGLASGKPSLRSSGE